VNLQDRWITGQGRKWLEGCGMNVAAGGPDEGG